MGKEERIILALGFVALVALIIFSRGGPIPLTGNPAMTPPDITTAPVDYAAPETFNYLTYNQPWLFSPPVANVLPAVASGQLGQAFPDNTLGDYTSNSNCGCT